jgi:hypothetical protein
MKEVTMTLPSTCIFYGLMLEVLGSWRRKWRWLLRLFGVKSLNVLLMCCCTCAWVCCCVSAGVVGCCVTPLRSGDWFIVLSAILVLCVLGSWLSGLFGRVKKP